jgi:hypothetical protein
MRFCRRQIFSQLAKTALFTFFKNFALKKSIIEFKMRRRQRYLQNSRKKSHFRLNSNLMFPIGLIYAKRAEGENFPKNRVYLTEESWPAKKFF